MQCECPLGFTLILLDFYCCTRVAQTHARLRPATALVSTAYADGNSVQLPPPLLLTGTPPSESVLALQ